MFLKEKRYCLIETVSLYFELNKLEVVSPTNWKYLPSIKLKEFT